MNIVNSTNPQIKFVEGDLFATEEYGADAIIVFTKTGFNPLNSEALFFKGKRTIHHRLRCNNHSRRFIHSKIYQDLNTLSKEGVRNIGIHCSICVSDSAIVGAYSAYFAVNRWLQSHNGLINSVMFVDKNGDYAKFLDDSLCKEINETYPL